MTKNEPGPANEQAEASAKLDEEIAGLPLEKCFEELEAIVEALENQTTSLEDSINLFERGMKLSRRCSSELTRVERRIQVIVENARGEVEMRDFDPESGRRGA
jgi:exodeoxyribonuclease VII small subunit